MTRFARAKGSKSSNERLPNEPTPWHIMKQQLEDNISSKNHQPEKAKTAKQLLSENDDPFYYDTTGNVNNDWAEFERPNADKSKKQKEEIKSNGTPTPKKNKTKFESPAIANGNSGKQDFAGNSQNTPKSKSNKQKSDISLTESADNSIKKINNAESTSVTPNKKSDKRKSNSSFAESAENTMQPEIEKNNESTSITPNKKSNKRKSNSSFAESAENAIEPEIVKNDESTSITPNKKSKKRKSEASFTESVANSIKVEEINNAEAESKVSPKKNSKKRKSDATAAESAETVVENAVKVEEANEAGSEPKKKKKRKEKKAKSSSVESTEVGELPKDKEEKEDGKVEGSKEPSGKMSKRQKRNQKRKNKIASNDAAAANDNSSGEKVETPASGGFDAAGNEWSSNVNFGKKIEKKFNGPANGNQAQGGNDFRRPMNRPNGPENNGMKRKAPKIRDDKEHKRRKPEVASIKCTINGMDVEIVKYDGFPVKKEDAERLKELRQQMVLKGIPKSEIDAAMKLERRKAEKALARVRKQVCFHCRKAGHNLSDCPELGEGESATGICFKCGSTEHTHFECKVTKKQEYGFASCFICREQGHIAKQCPDNPKGLYPQGGSCKICGDVTHLRKDCPDLTKEKEENAMTLNTIAENTLESLDEDLTQKVTNDDSKKTKGKIVKF